MNTSASEEQQEMLMESREGTWASKWLGARDSEEKHWSDSGQE